MDRTRSGQSESTADGHSFGHVSVERSAEASTVR
jgi:hypothetical protein